MRNALITRVFTSVLAGLLLLGALFFLSNTGFWYVIWGVSLLAWWEWQHVAWGQPSTQGALQYIGISDVIQPNERSRHMFSYGCIWLLGACVLYLAFCLTQVSFLYFLLVGWLVALFIVLVVMKQTCFQTLQDATFYVRHFIFWCAGLGYVILLLWPIAHYAPQVLGIASRVLLLKFLLLIWMCDIAGYFGGVTWGKVPCAPLLSPNKTWVGLSTSVLSCAVLFVGLFWGQSPGIGILFLLGAVFALLGYAGDIAESAIKRTLGVKDLGYLLPGHGGILDRIDGFLFAGAFYFALLHFKIIG